MAFVNEYIPEADYEKYDLRRICGEHNLAHRGDMHSRHWTIDRSIDSFLIEIWSHYQSAETGWAFYWQGNWIFFERFTRDALKDLSHTNNMIRGMVLPLHIAEKKAELLAALSAAFSAEACGGVFGDFENRTATIEFVKE
jgi:hypothetical protein